METYFVHIESGRKVKFYSKFGDFVTAMKEIMATTGNIEFQSMNNLL